MSITVLIADDHEIVRSGFRNMLQGSKFIVVGESSCGAEIFKQLETHLPNLVILDVQMRNGDGLYTMGRLRLEHPEIPVLMFSMYDNPTYVARAHALGAVGYLLKSDTREKILEALEKASNRETVWRREELRRVTGALATPRIQSDIEAPLTHRESEVLAELANGKTNKEIAQALDISYETVKEHVQHILRKIGVSNRTQAAVWAVRKNLV